MRTYRRVLVAIAVACPLMFVTAAAPSPGGPPLGGDSPASEPFVAPSPTGTAGAVETTGRNGRTQGPLPAAQAISELRKATSAPPAMSLDTFGHLRTVSAPAGMAFRTIPTGSDQQATAAAFVNRYGQAFGLRPGQRAVPGDSMSLPGGDRLIRFQQQISGVPVIGGDLLVTVGRGGSVVAATAEAPVDQPGTTVASVSAQSAVDKATAAAAERLGIDVSLLARGETKLWLYDPRMLGAPGRAQLRPTWVVRLAFRAGGEAATAFIDGLDGSTSLLYSEVKTARNRLICDLNGVRVDLNNPAAYACGAGVPVARAEGAAASTVADVNKAYDYLGNTYDFYASRFGRDSLDGWGMQLKATVRACDLLFCPFDNAFWDGAQMVFGTGYASADDVVAHELTHGVTDHLSQLYYAFQSGAINEAFSDIMGEFVDQSNGLGTDTTPVKWLLGEDLPATTGVLRSMSDPTQPLSSAPCRPNTDVFAPGCQPDRVGSPLYNFDPYELDNGGVHVNSGIANKAAYLLTEPGTRTFNGRSVTGLGIAKSAQLWYRTMMSVTSGADFQDLGTALAASCRRLVGFAGFTTADCVQVDSAVAATEMLTVYAGAAVDAPLCPAAGQPVRDIFYDGFEHGTAQWTTVGAQIIPSAALPIRWAHGGTHAAYLRSSQRMGPVKEIPIPADGQTYLAMAHAPLGGRYSIELHALPSGTGRGYEGSAWSLLSALGWTTAVQGYAGGYVSTRFDLSQFAGQRVVFTLDSLAGPLPDGTTGGEWLIDDLRIYQCLNQVGRVRNGAGELNAAGTAATLTWDAPEFTGPGVASYQVSVLPAVPGFPTTVPAGTTSLTMTGLDPTKQYLVEVRAVGADGVLGASERIVLTKAPNSDCGRSATGRPLWPCPPSRPS